MRYGRAPETLRDVNLNLQPGSFHFLTGASGAGKSTLLRLIYLGERPTRGLIRLFGQDVTLPTPGSLPRIRRRVGVVFQEFNLLEHLSVLDNAALPLRIAGDRPERYRANVIELLAWVGLGHRLHAMPATLSGGEKQRLAIARAVVAKPELLLADEPTGNVDEELAQKILRLFVELNKVGTTVLIATHDLQLVRHAGQPVLRLEEGTLHGPEHAPRSTAARLEEARSR